jgi:hypothetical protein
MLTELIAAVIIWTGNVPSSPEIQHRVVLDKGTLYAEYSTLDKMKQPCWVQDTSWDEDSVYKAALLDLVKGKEDATQNKP